MAAQEDPLEIFQEDKLFDLSAPKSLGYIFASTFLCYLQNFSMNFWIVNAQALAYQFQFSLIEIYWLYACYMIPLVSISFMLIKIRNQFGLRRFTRLSIFFFLLMCGVNLISHDFYSMMVTRFLSGISAAPIASMAFLYMMEPFKKDKKYTVGLSLHLTNVILGMPLALLFSTWLLSLGGYNFFYYFEIVLGLFALLLIYVFPLVPIPRVRVISGMDILAYMVIATGLGCNAVVMVMGPFLHWTESLWLGYLIIISIICFLVAVTLELNRKKPLIDVRWLFSREMIELVFILLAFRVLLSEQSMVVTSFFQSFGLINTNLSALYCIVIAGLISGGGCCAIFFRPGRENIVYFIALCFLLLGFIQGTYSTINTIPKDFYLGQFMASFGGAMFLPPTMARGLKISNAKGPLYTLSFIAVFLITQNTGGLVSTAFFKTLHFVFSDYHFMNAIEVLPELNNGGNRLQLVDIPFLEQMRLWSDVESYNDIFIIYAGFSFTLLLFFIIKLVYERAVQEERNLFE